MRHAAESVWIDALAAAVHLGTDPRSERVQYRELISRDAGRVDVRLRFDEEPFNRSELRQAPDVMTVVEPSLGMDCAWLTGGLLLAFSGAVGQTVHRDGGQLFRETGLPLPAHCLHVFVPLDSASCEIAPPMFHLGSHLTDTADSEAVAGVVPYGGALVFDYRILHYGSPNATEHDRWLAYLTFARSWFRDATNYPSRSLLDEPLPR
jgi:ectoine hydroxylase-related dioxygenase (phytanoyl-CoA dioxygenase family)